MPVGVLFRPAEDLKSGEDNKPLPGGGRIRDCRPKKNGRQHNLLVVPMYLHNFRSAFLKLKMMFQCIQKQNNKSLNNYLPCSPQLVKKWSLIKRGKIQQCFIGRQHWDEIREQVMVRVYDFPDECCPEQDTSWKRGWRADACFVNSFLR